MDRETRERRIKHYGGVDPNKLEGDAINTSAGFKRQIGKYMKLKRYGKAIHLLGNIGRDILDYEYIWIYNEDREDWIGMFREGFGFIDIRFPKSDCEELTQEDIDYINSHKVYIV